MLERVIISLAQFFFRASILTSHKEKLTARTRVLAVASFELPQGRVCNIMISISPVRRSVALYSGSFSPHIGLPEQFFAAFG
jgi:hypothetical protein